MSLDKLNNLVGLAKHLEAARKRHKRVHHVFRCCLCGALPAPFGFGPPMLPATIWACREHRQAIDDRLSERGSLLDVDPALAELPDWLR